MANDLEFKAYADLDTIASEAQTALDRLAADDVEGAQDILTDIKHRAEAWEA